MTFYKTIFLATLFVIGCTSHQNQLEGTDSLSTQAVVEFPTDTLTETYAEDTARQEKDSDCIFNDDYKGLTSEWLIELKKTNFIWRDDLKQALIPLGHDTIFISKGGCDHFGTSVELKLTNDFHTLTDSTFWIDKALELATEYHMENYSTMIKERRVRQAGEQENQIWYEVDDDNEEDFLYYNGIEIVIEGNIKRISISQYTN